MKKILLTLALGLGLLTANAQIEKLAGPRLGLTFIGAGPVADFLHEGFDFDDDRDGKHGSTGPAFTTQYGWQWESRFTSGTEFVGLVEWVLVVGGMEKGKFMPSASSIVGFRNADGLELGMGPNLSFGGLGMVFGIGMNYKSGNLNLPVNIIVVPPKEDSGFAISFMLGFNMGK